MKILVIAAHPDDEVLGCGGTLYKLSRQTDNKIYLAFAADGVLGRQKGKVDLNDLPDEDLTEIENRKKGAREVKHLLKAEILNISGQNFSFEFLDQRLDDYQIKEIIDWASGQISQVKPEIIYTHFVGDINKDHRLVAEAVLVATRPSKYEFIKKIYSFEINMADTNQGHLLQKFPFSPNVFEEIVISETRGKIKLFDQYKSEHKHWATWKKDIETLARYRGMNSGYDFAEAFILVRERHD